MRNFVIQLAAIRIQDSIGNKKTLSVSLGKDDVLRYNLYGSWQPTGISFSLSNLGMKEYLPMNPHRFKDTQHLTLQVFAILKTSFYTPICVEHLNDLKQALKQR